MYMNAKSVQEELKISEDDAKKITAALTAKMTELGRDAKPEERTEATAKILADGLKPDQIKRLHQIMWQKGSIGQALGNSEVKAALKLDEKQLEKVKSIQDDARKARTDLGRQADPAKMAELRKKETEDITAVLTDDQKKAWKDLLGPEFKGEIPAPGRRGGNPPGRN